MFFVSFLIALATNVTRLATLLHPQIEIIMDIPWVFDLAEFLYQLLFSWGSCFLLGILLLKKGGIVAGKSRKIKILQFVMVFLFLLLTLSLGILSEKYLFDNLMNSRMYRGNFVIRAIVSFGLIYVVVRVIRISQERRAKELENEMLRSAYFNAQLKNLKAQVNPHFLFNSLSSLSSLMTEDMESAQKYVANLAKVFRYSMSEHTASLVDLSKEVDSLKANIELLKIRFEDNLKITIGLEDIEKYQIPSMSLQPLLENVTKHNDISKKNPMYIDLIIMEGKIHFINRLTKPKHDVVSNGIGLFNLNERYKLQLNSEIVIRKTRDQFEVQLPLVLKKEYNGS